MRPGRRRRGGPRRPGCGGPVQRLAGPGGLGLGLRLRRPGRRRVWRRLRRRDLRPLGRRPGQRRHARAVLAALAAAEAAGRAERAGEGRAGRVAGIRRLGQRLRHDLVDRWRQVGAQGPQRRHGRGHLRPHHREARVALERRLPGEHLERGAGQGVEVGAAVERPALDLLRRHVVERAQELAGQRQRSRRDPLLAEPEVGQVQVVRLGAADQHVAGLHVAVHQAAGVRLVERGRGLGDEANGPGGRQPVLGLEQRAHVLPVDVAHGDEQGPVRLARVEDRDDVRVIDGRRGPHLPEKPLPVSLVAGELGCQDLQRHGPVQPSVGCAVDDRHPAAANLLFDRVTGYLRACREPARNRG